MMSQEQNDLITRIGPKDPCGKLMRMYWQPAALVDELQGPRAIRPVKLLGEELVMFRDEQGRYGLIDRHCAHRGADLAFGRLEQGGLRCAFHGWLFDVSGQCLQTPAEPKDSKLCQGIKQRAYPVVEKSGILWAYMGEGEPPAFPELDCFVAPDSHVFAFKGHWECNWLQALEVGVDPSHASYLHRFFEDEDTSASEHLWPPVPRRLRQLRHADDEDHARVRSADHQCRAHRIRHAPDHAARDRRRAHPCARHQPDFPARLRHPDEPGDDDHAVSRADRRRELLLVLDLHELHETGRQEDDARPAARDL